LIKQPRVDFTNIFALLSHKQDEKLFWQTANKFDKKCTNISLKFGVLFVGEIDLRIFCSPAIFCLAKKSLVKSTPSVLNIFFCIPDRQRRFTMLGFRRMSGGEVVEDLVQQDQVLFGRHSLHLDCHQRHRSNTFRNRNGKKHN